MVTSNSVFYVTGGTLQTYALSYVVRQADNDLLDGLRAGDYCYVLNTRQMGKSSLMIRTAVRLREEGFHVAILDLTSIGQNLSSEQWYGGLLGQLAEQLGLEDAVEQFTRDNEQLSPLQKFMEAIHRVVLPSLAGQVVVFIDEIDVVRSLPFSADELFAAIRESYNRRAKDPNSARVSFCLLGVATPSDLVADTRMSPFNIGRRIQIRDFTMQEAAPLAAGLRRGGTEEGEGDERLARGPAGLPQDRTDKADPSVAEDHIGYSQERAVVREVIEGPKKQRSATDQRETGENLLERVLYWTGGHPYMTQRLCRSIAEDVNASSHADVDRHCQSLFLTASASDMDDNLAFVRNRLLRSEVDLVALLEMYTRVRAGKRIIDDEADPLKSVLRLSGVVRVEDGLLKVRNRIYDRVFNQKWVLSHMPDAEMRRQRAAYRRGAAVAAAFFITIVAVVALVAVDAVRSKLRAHQALDRAIVAERNERIQSETSERLLYAADMELAQRAWDENNTGRVMDLLTAHTTRKGPDDERGFEWSYLWKQCHAAKFTLRGHTYPIRSIALSRDGGVVATGSYDKSVKIWDVSTGKEMQTLRGYDQGIWALCFTPDGTRLASGGGEGTIKLWDTATWTVRRTVQAYKHETFCLTFSPDGKTLATGGDDGLIKFWSSDKLEFLRSFHCQEGIVGCVAFSPDGRKMASGSGANTLRIWDLTSGKCVFTAAAPSSAVQAVAFSPDGRSLAAARNDYSTQIWDVQAGRISHTLRGHTGFVMSAVFTGDGRQLLTASVDGTAILWDLATKHRLRTFKGHRLGMLCADMSHDGRVVVTGSQDNVAKVWDVAAPTNPETLTGHVGGVWAVSVTRDGQRLATGGFDKVVRLWDLRTGQTIRTLKGHTDLVRSVSFSQDGRRLGTASHDKTGKVWDPETGQIICTLTGHKYSATAFAFSPDGRTAVTASDDNKVRIWDADSGRLKFTLEGHFLYVVDVAFSPDGKRIASASYDHSVILWDAANGRKIGVLEGHDGEVRCVRFSPNGKLIATASNDTTARVWDAVTFRLVQTMHGHMSIVQCVAWSPDGERLATGGYDNKVKVWDLASGRETLTLEGHTGSVWAIAFTPDGNSIITSSDDGTVKIWRAATNDEISANASQDQADQKFNR